MSPQEIRTKCNEVMALATQKFHTDFTGLQIRFDLKGRAMGMAGARNGIHYVRFNMEMIQRAKVEDQVDVISHEIAHVVCHKNPMLGRKHDAGWQRAHISLGGTARRTHDQAVVFAKGNTYEYTTSTGHKVRLSQIKHKRLQDGYYSRITFRQKGVITRLTPYVIVGVCGTTLATPKVPVSTTVARPLGVVEQVKNFIDGTGPEPELVFTPVARPRVVQPAQRPTYTGQPVSEAAKQLMGYGKPAVPSYKPATQTTVRPNTPLVGAANKS